MDGLDHLILASRRGTVFCYNVSGDYPEKIWEFPMPHEVIGSPVITHDTTSPLMYLGSKYGNLIAVDIRSGKEVWQKMVGNWIDNTACVGKIDGKPVVFTGSHDYNVYAFDAQTGRKIWNTTLGGEIHSAPCFFYLYNKPYISVASLDNHVYLLRSDDGAVENSFFTGQPICDKISKGENLWGSPSVVEAKDNSVIVYGSFNDTVFVLPLVKACTVTAMARSVSSLWWSLLVVMFVFLFAVLPIILKLH